MLPMASLLRHRCEHQIDLRARHERHGNSAAHTEGAITSALTRSLHSLVGGQEPEGSLEVSPSKGVHDYADARHLMGELLVAHEGCGRTWLSLALMEMRHVAADAGAADFEIASFYAPVYVGSWHVTAWLHLIFGKTAHAKLAFESALELQPNLAETRGGLAITAVLHEDQHAALALIESALELDPESVSANYARVLVLCREGRAEEAGELLGTMMARPGFYGDVELREYVMKLIDKLRRPGRNDRPEAMH
jgi:tetratricopeptide (TPR) repeat protein